MNKRFNTYLIAFLNALAPVILAFMIGAVAILIAKESPLETYWLLFSRSFLNAKGLMRTLHMAAPLILTGLAIAVSFKAGLFNMGVEGQLLVGGFVVAVLGYRLSYLPSSVLIPLCLFAGMISGVLTAVIPMVLKAFLNVNEMVVTLLLNYAIIEILEYLTSGVFRNPGSGYVATHMIGGNAILMRLFGSRITPFFFISIVLFIVMYVVMNRSKLGFEITAMGKNVEFAEATGMRVQKKIIKIFIISGMLSGIAGAGWMMSDKFSYTLDFSGHPGLGWDGMLIALLGSHSPVGILIAAIFYAALKVGSHSIAIYSNVPAEIISLIQALIVLFLSVKLIKDERFMKRLKDMFSRSKDKEGV